MSDHTRTLDLSSFHLLNTEDEQQLESIVRRATERVIPILLSDVECRTYIPSECDREYFGMNVPGEPLSFVIAFKDTLLMVGSLRDLIEGISDLETATARRIIREIRERLDTQECELAGKEHENSDA